MKTMKAAVVPYLGAKLELQELPIPEPGPGQVLIRMQASGLCHTDIHAANGDWPVKPAPPFVPGHEGIGTVVARSRRWPAPARRACLDCLAGLGVRALPVLHLRLGDLVRIAAEQRLLGERCLGRVRGGRRRLRGHGPDSVSSFDAAPLPVPGSPPSRRSKCPGSRRRDGGGFRRRGSRPPGRAVRQAPGRPGDRRRYRGRQARPGRRAWRGLRDQRTRGRPGPGDPGSGWCRRRRLLATSPRAFEQAFGSLRNGGRLVCVALPADGEMTVPISTRCSAGNRSSAPSSAPAWISPTSSRCMQRAAPRSSPRSATSRTSTPALTMCSPAGCPRAWSSPSDRTLRDHARVVLPWSGAAEAGRTACTAVIPLLIGAFSTWRRGTGSVLVDWKEQALLPLLAATASVPLPVLP